MKKFITGLFFSLVFIVVLIMLFSVPKNSFFRDKAGAYWSGGSTVTFDDIDYSVNLPYNTSLNDINSSQIIQDTGFTLSTNLTLGSGNNKLNNYWRFINNSQNNITITPKSFSGVNISGAGVASFNYIMSNNLNFLPNTTYYVYFSYNNVVYSGSLTTPNALDGLYGAYSFELDKTRPTGLICRMEKYNNNFNNLNLNIGNSRGDSFSVEFASLSTQPYYSNYSNLLINQLIENFDIYNSNYTWSTSPVMSIAYDFDTFTPDTILYYIKDIPVFNISKTLPNYLSALSSKTTFTEDVLKQLKNSYNSLSTSFPSATDLQIKKFLDIIEAIFNILVSTFKVLFYSAEVASFTGLLAFAPILDMFTYLSIILYSSFNSWFTL